MLFICTANSLDTIPGPLLDRMEVIRLSGYDAPEKLAIAKAYLDPKIRTEVGLARGAATTPKSVELTEGALDHLIRWHAREAGVRNLEKLIGKIYRKAAIRVVQAREAAVAKLKAAGAWPTAEAEAKMTALKAAAEAKAAEAKAKAEAEAKAKAEADAKAKADAAAATASAVSEPAADADKPASGAGATVGSSTAAPTAAAPAAAAVEETPLPPLEALVEVDEPEWTITADNLESYVGKAPFTSDRLYDVTPPGVIMGLAWTNMGGSALYIETVSPSLPRDEARKRSRAAAAASGNGSGGAPAAGDVIITPSRSGEGEDGEGEGSGDEGGSGKGKGKGDSGAGSGGGGGGGGHLRLTGKMGEVMQESAQIAYTVARRYLRGVPGQETNTFLDSMQLHMHVPEGATPKDGPSAGITMVTALLSTAMNKPARPDLAMTGEVTLTGKVLPVGGIKEKIMAARRANIRVVVLPAGCRKDYDELPPHLKEGLAVHFAREYADVFDVAFSYDPSLIEEERRRLAAAHPAHESPSDGRSGTGGEAGTSAAGFAHGRPAAGAPRPRYMW